MSVQEVIESIPQMTPDEWDEITRALDEARAKAEEQEKEWDEQIEREAAAGRFDGIKAKIKADLALRRDKPHNLTK